MSAGTPAPIATPTVDAHAHTWSREFDADYEATMARARAAGVRAVVESGTDSASSRRARELARAGDGVYATAGLHPHDAKRLPSEQEALRALLDEGGFVAVGEIGLDFYRDRSPREDQYRALRWQLALAHEASLPVVIHARDADAECFSELSAWADRAGRYLGADREVGMLHCYAGDLDMAHRYRDLGFMISVPGTVTYAGNSRGQQVARELPLDGLLVETDCPYLTPQPYRGTRNEPAYVVSTVRAIAELRGCPADEVAAATTANAERLFGFTLSDGGGQ